MPDVEAGDWIDAYGFKPSKSSSSSSFNSPSSGRGVDCCGVVSSTFGVAVPLFAEDFGTNTFALAARDARLLLGVQVLPGARRSGDACEVVGVEAAEEGVNTGADGVKAIDEAVRFDDGVDGRDEAGVAALLRLPCVSLCGYQWIVG